MRFEDGRTPESKGLNDFLAYTFKKYPIKPSRVTNWLHWLEK
jgi:hypothetical protein